MTRPLVPLLAAGIVVAALTWCDAAAAQQPPTAAPEPKMPPMPSMEGQQGDVSKPVTQIPPRKKPAAAEFKSPAVKTPVAKVEKKNPRKPPRSAPRHGKR